MSDRIANTLSNPVEVLIIDDDPYILPLLQDSLFDQQEISISATSDSMEAIEKIRSKQFDLVITDLNMPIADGLTVISVIRENSPDTLIVIITGFPSLDSAIEAIRMRVFDYLPKPFSAHEFRFVVKKAVEQILLRRENCLLREELVTLKQKLASLNTAKKTSPQENE